MNTPEGVESLNDEEINLQKERLANHFNAIETAEIVNEGKEVGDTVVTEKDIIENQARYENLKRKNNGSVVVHRHSGEIEDDWEMGAHMDLAGRVMVWKKGTDMHKSVRLEDLISWNE